MQADKMFSTIDTHVAGESFRIIIQSSINLNENDIKLNGQLLQKSYQDEKDFLLNEPRGHRGMNGCIITPSRLADYGLLFFNHNQEVPFKYGGLVASVTALIETGNLKVNETGIYKIETIQGTYEVRAIFENQEVTKVYIESNACKVLEENDEYQVVEVDESSSYIISPLPTSIPGIHLDHLSLINKWGKKATEKFANENIPFDGMIITEQMDAAGDKIRSVTFEKDGSILRSPGMESTFANLTALRQSSNEKNQLINYSIFDSSITATCLPGTSNRFSVEIQGFITGMHQFIFDQTDPLKNGFLLK